MKKKFLKTKIISAAVAAACAVNGILVSNFATAADADIYEFEEGTLNTADRIYDGEDREGNAIEASGGKFVFLQDAGETASVEVNVEETGMYSFTISAYAAYGSKIHNLLINGVDQGQISFEENKTGFVDVPIGSFKLEKGTNTVTIQSNWGWTYIDCLKVSTAELPSLNAPKVLSDGKATDETKRLMSYLVDVYGKNVISGQQEIYMWGRKDSSGQPTFEYDFDWLKENTGKYPAMRGFDFLNCANILYGSEDGTVDRMIDWANNKNGIVTASWHVTVPKQFASYEQGVTNVDWGNATYVPEQTDFDTSKAVIEGTKENKYYMACLEALAKQLQKLQEAKVPVIFRPLHEAEGGGGEEGSWFWWGKSGSEVYKKLWKLTYNTLTETYGLHNLIWEWNSYAYATSKNWYPGDEYVDIVGYDKYNCTDWSTGSPVIFHNDSAISGTFYNLVEMYDGKKMVAMAENDNVPTLKNLTEEKAAWLTFCTWYDSPESDTDKFLTNPIFNKVEDLKELYNSDYCITLDEMPTDIYKTYSMEGFGESPERPTEPTTEPTTTEPTTTAATTNNTTVTTTTSATTAITDVPATVTTTKALTTPELTTAVTTTQPPATGDSETLPPYTGNKDELVYGDVNLDGWVTSADTVKLAKYMLSKEMYSLGKGSESTIAKAKEQADVKKDNVISTEDTMRLNEYNLRNITEDQLGKK